MCGCQRLFPLITIKLQLFYVYDRGNIHFYAVLSLSFQNSFSKLFYWSNISKIPFQSQPSKCESKNGSFNRVEKKTCKPIHVNQKFRKKLEITGSRVSLVELGLEPLANAVG